MPILTENELENRVSNNTTLYNKGIERVKAEIRNKNLKRGRVRPRNSDEAEVLSRFDRKRKNDEY